MSLIDDGLGICQIMAAKKVESAGYWEGRRAYEKTEELERRHSRARILCWRCPALEECEARLVEFEENLEHVDGVVAGRYSIIRTEFKGTLQKLCACCASPLKGAHEPAKKRGVLHAGEGLCEKCYPMMRRKRK